MAMLGISDGMLGGGIAASLGVSVALAVAFLEIAWETSVCNGMGWTSWQQVTRSELRPINTATAGQQGGGVNCCWEASGCLSGRRTRARENLVLFLHVGGSLTLSKAVWYWAVRLAGSFHLFLFL